MGEILLQNNEVSEAMIWVGAANINITITIAKI